MLALTFVGLAATACVLAPTIDPNSACVEDANGFSTLDADSDAGIPISLTISPKSETVDAFAAVHPATVGALSDDTATDGRYVLSCPQESGKKTVQFSISRPADLTAFGAEWVQLFPKDSWSNITNEYEPFSFNEFGAKIPLPEFRPTSDLSVDAANEPVLHVFMEVSGEGDYELKYGNPNLLSGGKWVAVEFKSTLLRVGAPWADCTGSALAAPSYAVGSIVPILFGGPNVNSIALKAGFPSYDDAIADLSGVSVPVQVVLGVFNADKTSYTSSTADGQCYKAGNACPENHNVCKPEYCEMDVWAAIIAGFKAASPGKVTVLGSIDASTSPSAYDDLAMDGFYGGEGALWSADPSPPYGAGEGWTLLLTQTHANDNFAGSVVPFKQTLNEDCVGEDCTTNAYARDWSDSGLNLVPKAGDEFMITSTVHNTYVTMTLNTWCAGSSWEDFSASGPCGGAGYHPGYGQGEVFNADGSSRGQMNFNGCSHAGNCYNGGGDGVAFSTHNVAANSYADCFGGCYNQVMGASFYWAAAEDNSDVMSVWFRPSDRRLTTEQVTVSAIGTPLFDEGAVDDASVYVTLASSDIGIWSPFAWYPSVSPSKWAAIVTEATDTSAIATLFDRGYGWVYLTSETGFATASTMTAQVLSAIEATATTRRLDGRRLEASRPFWGCDDTLFECRPICMKQIGVVTAKVSDKLCAGEPQDMCACTCYWDAEWTCEGSAVVCKARLGAGELKTVGDKVCETRGAPKPASSAELRVASKCEPVTEMRGSTPTAQCLDQWGTPEPTDAPTDAPADAPTKAPADVEQVPLLQESFASTFVLAAFALQA
jgi:hypothetical protein